MRNNINGNYEKIEDISQIKPGAFINILWNNIDLMLPYSPRNDFISFSDKKWDFRYSYNDLGNINELEPTLFEILTNGKDIEHKCRINK